MFGEHYCCNSSCCEKNKCNSNSKREKGTAHAICWWNWNTSFVHASCKLDSTLQIESTMYNTRSRTVHGPLCIFLLRHLDIWKYPGSQRYLVALLVLTRDKTWLPSRLFQVPLDSPKSEEKNRGKMRKVRNGFLKSGNLRIVAPLKKLWLLLPFQWNHPFLAKKSKKSPRFCKKKHQLSVKEEMRELTKNRFSANTAANQWLSSW